MNTLALPICLICHTRLLHRWLCAVLVGLASLMLLSPVVQAQDAPYDRVQRLLQAGELTLALTEAQTWLDRQPRDPQMRFLKGVIHKQRGDMEAARITFVELTREFPELPEPYNNLAVLDAAAGRLNEAREALVMALRLNPAYATAQRNLGNLYLRLAADAYRAALQHDPGATDTAQRLQAVEQLLANTPTP